MQHNLKYFEELREYAMRVSDFYLKNGDYALSAHAARKANLIQDFVREKLAQCGRPEDLDEFQLQQQLLNYMVEEEYEQR